MKSNRDLLSEAMAYIAVGFILVNIASCTVKVFGPKPPTCQLSLCLDDIVKEEPKVK